MTFDISSYLEERKRTVECKLDSYFKDLSSNNTTLHKSMEYGILAGGKRLRPVFCMAACEAVCGEYDKAVPVACAIEMIHTYSLIHDDLPSMDDDDLRRGKPTNHRKFGEAAAILTGDALLTDAFGLIASEGFESGLSADQVVSIIRELSSAAGSRGMVLGQSIDLELEGKQKVDIDTLRNMHSLKTGALIEASLVSGGITAGADEVQIDQLRAYAGSIGLAYQIIDDVLDVEGGKALGKEKGADSRKSKTTYISVLGTERSKQMAVELTSEAVSSIGDFNGNPEILKELAYYLGKREY